MRGSPLLRAALAFFALLSLAPLLWRMTSASVPAPPSPAPPPPVGSKQEIQLALTFTTPPTHIAISHLGTEVWKKGTPENDEEITLHIPWPAEGGELLFTLAWPENSPTAAMRAILTDPAGEDIERILWARGPVEKILRFP